MDIFPARALIDLSQTEGIKQQRTPDDWYWHLDGNYRGATLFNINLLYRGQNKRYTPMLPSKARGLISNTGIMSKMPPSDQAQIILRLAQSWWFARQLDYHPITIHAEEQKVKIDRIALAQHYGIPTGYLDLTDSFDISAFFATCFEDESGWAPVKDGVGAIYRVEIKKIKNSFEWLAPLGPQSLPRPEEQNGWVGELPMTHSFDGWPFVSLILFNQDPAIGEHFLEMFNGGKGLFPPDPLADVADKILKCGEIPEELIDGALDSFHEDKFGPTKGQFSSIKLELSKIIKTCDYRRILTEEDIEPFINDMEWRKKRLSDIVANCRPVRLEIRPD